MFQPLSEAFIRRSWYSVLPVLDTTGRCRVKKASSRCVKTWKNWVPASSDEGLWRQFRKINLIVFWWIIIIIVFQPNEFVHRNKIKHKEASVICIWTHYTDVHWELLCLKVDLRPWRLRSTNMTSHHWGLDTAATVHSTRDSRLYRIKFCMFFCV